MGSPPPSPPVLIVPSTNCPMGRHFGFADVPVQFSVASDSAVNLAISLNGLNIGNYSNVTSQSFSLIPNPNYNEVIITGSNNNGSSEQVCPLYGKTALGSEGSYGYFNENSSMYLSAANSILQTWNLMPIGSLQGTVSLFLEPLFQETLVPAIIARIVGQCVKAFEPNPGNTLYYFDHDSMQTMIASEENKTACTGFLYQAWDDSGDCPLIGNNCPWYCINYTYDGDGNFSFSDPQPI